MIKLPLILSLALGIACGDKAVDTQLPEGDTDTQTSCWIEVEAFVARAETDWSPSLAVLTADEVSIWPNATAFDEALAGEQKRYFDFPGGSDRPTESTWFQQQPVVVTKVHG